MVRKKNPEKPPKRRSLRAAQPSSKDNLKKNSAPQKAEEALKIRGGGYVKYFGKGSVYAAVSSNGKVWETTSSPLLEPRATHFDDSPLTALHPPILISEGILVLYFISSPVALGAAIFEKNDPLKLISRSDRAFWATEDPITPLSVERLKDHLILHFRTARGTEIKTVIPLLQVLSTQKRAADTRKPPPRLVKHSKNPIIEPNAKNSWESQATFNPAALHLKGKVHILYRAVGDDGVSVVGYATSTDGVHVDERSPRPVYIPYSPFDKPTGERGVDIFPSASGGGFGGSEDPRLTEVEGRVYMTYTAFDGRHPPGVALTSISTKDFLDRRWNKWKKPSLISQPGQQHKNWVVFPKKIKGKYAVLHSISPEILIDYFDNLDFDDSSFIKSRHAPKNSDDRWDNQPRGVGAPPIETPSGWLVLYHAMDSRDPNKYKVGALLLDPEEPTKVLHRSLGPVLEPDEPYENRGYKAGVVYTCGAVILDNVLHVYYGGADTVTCVASYPLDQFLAEIKK